MRSYSLLLASAGIAALASGAALNCGAGDCAPAAWDSRLLGWFASASTPVFGAMFSAVTWLGSLWLLLPAALVVVIGLVMHGRTRDALRFAMAFGGSALLAYVAKFLIGRERPLSGELLVAMPADPSYPSGHAMQITAFVLAAVWLLMPRSQRGRWFAAALMLIALVGASRLYLQVHFPSDVVVGTVAASLWVLAVMLWKKPSHA